MLEKDNIYLIGIGGIGMSALARYFLHLGRNVGGYDRTQTHLSKQLEAEGIDIHYEDSVELVPAKFKDPNTCLVIYTPAIPAEHEELAFFRENYFELHKRAKVLGEISRSHQCLAVAGTHGKTTTSALLAHIFRHSGRQINAFLGGLSVNYQSNFLSGEDEVLVAEADEYDRSFLQLRPAGAIITSTDSDHLDVYGTSEDLINTFGEFSRNVEGPLIVHSSTGLDGITYSLDNSADFSGENIRVENHQFVFDLISKKHSIQDIKSGLPGRHNVENALAAASLALNFGISENQVKAAIESFKGVRRRFEYHIRQKDLVYIDDYAHHPAEIRALVSAVRELYPNKRITGVFQPHLYSRTRDFMDSFARELEKLDELILMDIYPARERPIPGVNSNILLSMIELQDKKLMSFQDILQHFSRRKPDVVLSIGAGDIDQLIPALKMKLLE